MKNKLDFVLWIAESWAGSFCSYILLWHSTVILFFHCNTKCQNISKYNIRSLFIEIRRSTSHNYYRHLTVDIRLATFDIWHSTSEVRRSAFETRHLTFAIRQSSLAMESPQSTFDVRRSACEVQHSTFDIRHSIFDIRCSFIIFLQDLRWSPRSRLRSRSTHEQASSWTLRRASSVPSRWTELSLQNPFFLQRSSKKTTYQ